MTEEEEREGDKPFEEENISNEEEDADDDSDRPSERAFEEAFGDLRYGVSLFPRLNVFSEESLIYTTKIEISDSMTKEVYFYRDANLSAVLGIIDDLIFQLNKSLAVIKKIGVSNVATPSPSGQLKTAEAIVENSATLHDLLKAALTNSQE